MTASIFTLSLFFLISLMSALIPRGFFSFLWGILLPALVRHSLMETSWGSSHWWPSLSQVVDLSLSEVRPLTWLWSQCIPGWRVLARQPCYGKVHMKMFWWRTGKKSKDGAGTAKPWMPCQSSYPATKLLRVSECPLTPELFEHLSGSDLVPAISNFSTLSVSSVSYLLLSQSCSLRTLHTGSCGQGLLFLFYSTIFVLIFYNFILFLRLLFNLSWLYLLSLCQIHPIFLATQFQSVLPNILWCIAFPWRMVSLPAAPS